MYNTVTSHLLIQNHSILDTPHDLSVGHCKLSRKKNGGGENIMNVHRAIRHELLEFFLQPRNTSPCATISLQRLKAF